MAETTVQKLRGLFLSAIVIKDLNPDWSEAMIEDYLSAFDNLVTISESIDTVAPPDTNTVSRAYFYGRVY